MPNDLYAPPKSKLQDPPFSGDLPVFARLACWSAPFIAVGGYLMQWIYRFPPDSVGVGFTILGVLVGEVGAVIASVYLLVRAKRLPSRTSGETRLLRWLNGAIAALAMLSLLLVLLRGP